MPAWGVGILGVGLVVLVLAAAALLSLDRFARSHPQDLGALRRRHVLLHDQPLTLLLADSPETAGPGLSGQEALSADEGLLLTSSDGDTRVTMLGMRFALDVVWLDGDGRVVGVRRRLAPRLLPLSYAIDRPAVAVLELTAGGIDRYGIEPGDVIGS